MPPARPIPDGFLPVAASGKSVHALAIEFAADPGTVARWLNLPAALRYFGNRRGGIRGQATRAAEEEASKSITTLVEIRDDDDQPAVARVGAVKVLLDIAEVGGRQRVELSGEVRTGPLEGKSDAEVERIPFDYVVMALRDAGEDSLAFLVEEAANRLAPVKSTPEEEGKPE